ncbi:50S ribosomal protein L30e [Candidatus Bathyarchaeota archaeon]|nr:50S ribosomal protein L30e [Candidatus Bathyarchaeota archaeon]
MDFNRQMAITLKTGKIELGMRSAATAARLGRAKLIVLASNCPGKESILKEAKASGVPVYLYEGTSMELGRVCGKPFIISAMTVKEPGDSEILKLAETQDAVSKD